MYVFYDEKMDSELPTVETRKDGTEVIRLTAGPLARIEVGDDGKLKCAVNTTNRLGWFSVKIDRGHLLINGRQHCTISNCENAELLNDGKPVVDEKYLVYCKSRFSYMGWGLGPRSLELYPVSLRQEFTRAGADDLADVLRKRGHEVELVKVEPMKVPQPNVSKVNEDGEYDYW
jgi:hypothetical protein